jgi:Tol biopolymer transport system component/fibronectin type 3 domain-containing protein
VVAQQPVVDTTYTDAALSDGVYTYRIDAMNTCGVEGASAEVMATVGDVVAPAAPLNLIATASDSDITLSWLVNPEPDVVGYNVYRETPQGLLKLNALVVTDPTYTDTQLPNGSYTYRVTAVDTVGNESEPSDAAVVQVDIVPPPVPFNLRVEVLSEGEALQVSWEHAGDAIAGFNLYRSSTTGGPYSKVNDALLTDNAFLDTDLTNGAPYFYVAVAVDVVGNESDPSDEASGLPVDTLSPELPEVFSASVSDACVVVYGGQALIAGLAEPGSTLELFNGGRSVGLVTALNRDVSHSVTFDYNGDGADLSPDGKTLAYAYNGALWLMDVATEGIQQLVQDGESPVWSPDGRQLAYEADDRLHLYDLASERHTPLTGDIGVREAGPSWSFDGRMMAFKSNRSGTHDIWIRDLILGAMTRVTDGVSPGVFQLAPDGNKLAYFISSRLVVVDLPGGAATEIDSQTDRESLAWSPDSTSLAFASRLNGNYDIVVWEVTTQQQMQITDSPQDEFDPQFSPDGQALMVALGEEDDESTSVMIVALQAGAVAQPLNEGLEQLNAVFWVASGRIAFIDQQTLYTIDGVGQFAFAAVVLEPGENRFHVVSIDASGNVSLSSEARCFLYDTSLLPDLEVTADDIFVYPSSPLEGDEVAIIVVVRNRGAVTAKEAEVDIYLFDATGVLEQVASDTLPSLSPQSEAVLAVDWDSTGKRGTNSVIVIADAKDTFTEITESNNVATRDILVVTQAGCRWPLAWMPIPTLTSRTCQLR